MTPDNKIDVERIPVDFFKRREPKQAQKTGNLFLVSCLGVPFYVAAVILFLLSLFQQRS